MSGDGVFGGWTQTEGGSWVYVHNGHVRLQVIRWGAGWGLASAVDRRYPTAEEAKAVELVLWRMGV
jgi:hypothetical protein